jgi:TPR repeat protein
VILFAAWLVSSAIAQIGGTSPTFQPNATPEEKIWAENLIRSAEQGNAEAQFNLSQNYMDGHVFTQSWPETIKWLRASAEQGFLDSQANLGALYYVGKGVPRDYSQAVLWSQKAADQGNVKAEYNLGLMYALGQGVKKSKEQAVHWYLKAARQGHQVAAYDVGVAYWYGMGIQQDQVKGYKWLLLALHFGWEKSKNALDSLGPTLPPEKIAEARKQAAEWIKAHPDVKAVSL